MTVKRTPWVPCGCQVIALGATLSCRTSIAFIENSGSGRTQHHVRPFRPEAHRPVTALMVVIRHECASVRCPYVRPQNSRSQYAESHQILRWRVTLQLVDKNMGMYNSSTGSRFKQVPALGRVLQAAPALLWRTDTALSTNLFALQVCQTLVPLAQLWVAKLIIDRLATARRLPHPLDSSHPVLWLVALEFVLAVLGLLLREGSNYQRQVLAERVTGYVSLTILTHTQRLDLSMLEQPEFYDRVRRAEESAFYRPAALLSQLLDLVRAM